MIDTRFGLLLFILIFGAAAGVRVSELSLPPSQRQWHCDR